MLLGCLVHNNIRLSTNPSSCKPRTHYLDLSLDLNAFKVTLSSSGIVHTLTKSLNIRSYILGTCECIKYPITLQEHHLQVMQRGAPRTFGISNRSYFGHISPIVPHTFERIEDIGRVISVLLCPNLPGGRAPHWAEQGHYFTAVTVSPPSIFFSICSIIILQFRAMQFSSLFSHVYFFARHFLFPPFSFQFVVWKRLLRLPFHGSECQQQSKLAKERFF